jgi:predicted nucleotidyltransferase
MRYDEALDRCIFRYVSGSHAYGTERPDSDEDIRGVFMAPLGNHFDLFQSSFMGHGPINEQLKRAMRDCDEGNLAGASEMIRKALETDQGDLAIGVETVHNPKADEELHELRKFLKLAAECNPNIIEFLYVDRLVMHETDVWRRIRENRHLFLSKKARYTFSGYAIAQLKRIRTHRGYLLNPPAKKPERKDFGLPEDSKIPKEGQNAVLSMKAEWLAGGVRDMVINEKRYKVALDDWTAYKRWENERNPARKEMERQSGFDRKHSVHLVRLTRMAKEILAEGEVRVFRPDRDELRAILNGEWSFERVLAETENMDQELEELYAKSTLRDKPDRKRIAELYKDICKEAYGLNI